MASRRALKGRLYPTKARSVSAETGPNTCVIAYLHALAAQSVGQGGKGARRGGVQLGDQPKAGPGNAGWNSRWP